MPVFFKRFRTDKALLVVAVAFAAEIATHSTIDLFRLHLNYTNSVPLGIYREVPKANGEFVGFCPGADVIERAMAAGLQTIPGDCPNHSAPILKPLFEASKSQPLSFTARGFVIGGKLVANTAPKAYSRTGAPLSHYAFGTYTSGLWAISSFNPSSYDSRYFGPVDPASIRFYAKPVWTR